MNPPQQPAQPSTGRSLALPPGIALQIGHWQWWYAPIGFGASIVVPSILPFIGLATVYGQVVQFIIYILIAIGLPWLFSRRIAPEDVGLEVRRIGWTALVVLLGWALFFVLVYFFEKYNAEGAEAGNEVLRSFGLGKTVEQDFGMIISTVIFAPLGEEMLFRALIHRSLRDGLARWLSPMLTIPIALAVSGYLFATSHGGEGQDKQLVMLFIFALILALSYEITGSIYAPILIHSLNNTVAFAQGLWQAEIALTASWLYPIMYAGPLLTLALVWLLQRLVPRYPPVAVSEGGVRQGTVT